MIFYLRVGRPWCRAACSESVRDGPKRGRVTTRELECDEDAPKWLVEKCEPGTNQMRTRCKPDANQMRTRCESGKRFFA